MNELFAGMIKLIVVAAGEVLMPFMLSVFVLAAFLRVIIYFTVRCEYRFAQEFEKRVHRYMSHEDDPEIIASFYRLCKRLFEKTYHEHFELKRKYRRRRFDHVTSVTDRIFLIEEGVVRLIRDCLGQLKYLKKNGKTPKFVEISKYVFGANPVFNKVFGIFPMGTFNDILNVLPGLFVVGGIFGTFVGVMQGLPALSQMDVANVEATKRTMDTFLMNIAFSMGASAVGIVYSVLMTILNVTLTPESIYINMVNKLTSSLEFLWNETETNEVLPGDVEVPKDRRGMVYANEKASRAEDEKKADSAPAKKSVAAAAGVAKASPAPNAAEEKLEAPTADFVPKFDRVREIEIIADEMDNPLHSVIPEGADETVSAVAAPVSPPLKVKVPAPPPIAKKRATPPAPAPKTIAPEEPAASEKLALLMQFKERLDGNIRKAKEANAKGQLTETELEEKLGVWTVEKKELEKQIAVLLLEISKQRAA